LSCNTCIFIIIVEVAAYYQILRCHLTHCLAISININWCHVELAKITWMCDFSLYVLGVTLNCIHLFIVTISFIYWCVMRPASLRFFICSSIYLRILSSYLATFLDTNSLAVLKCRKAVNQSLCKLLDVNHKDWGHRFSAHSFKIFRDGLEVDVGDFCSVKNTLRMSNGSNGWQVS